MKTFQTLTLVLAGSLLCASALAEIRSSTFTLSSGQAVPIGELEVVGRLPGCTATLITERLVLTAAHCVCPNDNNALNCSARTTFTLTDVRPVDNPATPADESQVRTNVAVPGNVIVHPNFAAAGWLRSDFAL
ncbi:MAG: trypsin-like serine protease, partial [Alphaproteobacteria bacterium]